MMQHANPYMTMPPDASLPARTSGMAITSLVLAILGFCTGGLTGLIGVILGIIAISAINKSAGTIRGSGLAISGIIVGAVSLLVTPCLLMGLLLPAFSQARMAAQTSMATVHLKEIGNAMNFYNSDHGKFPDAQTWDAALATYVPNINQTVSSPFDSSAGRAYAMNAQLDSIDLNGITRPDRTVLLFECAPGSPLAGGPDLLAEKPRHPGKGYLILFADLSVRNVRREDLPTLKWEP